jgi:peptide/nickel transport system substrate-binding protein
MASVAKYLAVGLFVFMLVVTGFNGSASAQSQSAGKPQSGGTFTWNHNGGIPQIGAPADNLGAFVANRNSYPALETLLKTDEKENLQPNLAESWKVSGDGKSITFRLRKGIKFHDGTPFNAEAVKYNLEAVAKANIRGSIILTKVASYDVVDEYTLRMNLKEWDSTLLLRLAQSAPGLGLMASPTAMKKEVTPETMAKLHCVGTGPFVFDSWKRDSFVKYKKWDGYWQKGKPYLDEIKIQSIADLTVSIMSFKSGEAQAIENIDPVDAKQLEKEGFEIWQPNLYFLHSFIPDGGNPNSPFAKKNVRLALDYAIDKRAIAKGVGMGYYEPLSQLAATKSPWYNPALPYREYDPKKAKQLLAEAGYPNGFKTKLVSDVMARKDTLVAVQTYLKEAGIETELEVLEFGAAFVKSKQGWEGIYFPGFPHVGTLVGVVERWGTPNDYISFYRPPGWQEKWNALLAQKDQKKLMGQLKELVKILYDEAVGIPYQGDAPLMAHSKKLHEFNLHSDHMVSYYEPQNVWLSK